MAAPNTAYYNNAGTYRKLKEAGVLEIAIPPALPLAEYGATMADIKALFFLDEVRRMAVKDALGTVTEVFIGMVKPGSPNASMRNASRLTRRRTSKLVGGIREDYIWLDDAGLNTKGTCTVGELLIGDIESEAEVASAVFNSAYWVDTDEYGFVAAIGGTGGPQQKVGGFLAKNSSITKLSEKLSAKKLKVNPYQSFSLRGYIINSEGTYFTPYSASVQFTAVLLSVGYHSWDAQDAAARNTVVNVYASSSLTSFPLGRQLWQQAAPHNPVVPGWYDDGMYCYFVSFDNDEQAYMITYVLNSGDPAPEVTVNWTAGTLNGFHNIGLEVLDSYYNPTSFDIDITIKIDYEYNSIPYSVDITIPANNDYIEFQTIHPDTGPFNITSGSSYLKIYRGVLIIVQAF